MKSIMYMREMIECRVECKLDKEDWKDSGGLDTCNMYAHLFIRKNKSL